MNKKILLVGLIALVAVVGCSQKNAVRKSFVKIENAIVENDFATWESMLTPKLKELYSKPKEILKGNTPKGMETLDDYFRFKVESRVQMNNGKPFVPHRIDMKSETKAVVFILMGSEEDGGKEFPQGTLVNRDGKWLLATEDEE